METDEEEQLVQTLPRVRNWDGSSCLYQYQGFWFPSQRIHGVISFQRQFEVRDTDLFLSTFPKCGTTWLKALMFSIVNRGRYSTDNSPLLTTSPHDLISFTELDLCLSNKNHLPDPRIFTTGHTPYALLPVSIRGSGCRIVYMCRNPLDQFISQWHFSLQHNSKENVAPPLSLEECFDMYCNGIHNFGPFCNHVLWYWKASLENPNKVLFLKYEDMKEDSSFEHMKKLAEFLGCPFSADEERDGVIEEVSNLCSFQTLKSLQVNQTGRRISGTPNSSFFRKGKVGDWTNYLTPSMAERLNNLVEEKLAGSGLTFKAS